MTGTMLTLLDNCRITCDKEIIHYVCVREKANEVKVMYLNVKRFQSMSVRTDEIETTMDTIVDNVFAVQTAFISQVTFELFINVTNDLLERISVVDGIAKAGCVNNCQT